MKAFVALLFVWILPDWACLAQTLRITAFDRAGDLRWTNLLCTTEPVYEVLQAMSPSGPWSHLAFATNQTSLVVSNPSAPGSEARFFKLTWVHDPPLEFDYTFDEYQFGYGFSITTVT